MGQRIGEGDWFAATPATTFAGAHASLGFASLRGRFAASLAGAHASLGFASLRGRFAALHFVS